MLSGVHLTLLIGPMVPIPAPQPVMDALVSAQVTSGKDKSGFQLTFAVGKKSTLQNILLPLGYFDPMLTRVIIIATVNGFPNVLMDGIVTRQEVTPSSEPGQSTLTITGEDLSVLMDVVEKVMPFTSVPREAQVLACLAPYMLFGIVPIVIPAIIPVVKTPMDQWDSQVGQTDLAYIQSLAQDAGYVFYVEPGPLPGQSIAYWGPDIRIPVPQPALTINMDAHTNVDSLSFSLDGLAKKITLFTIMDPGTQKIPIPIPVPNVNIFKPPLGLRPTPPAKLTFSRIGAELSAAEAAGKILASLMNNPDAVTGTGSLDVVRYGQSLRSRMLVGVRGAGITYDGMYYVDSVTHDIKRGEYKQNFTISRDGLIASTPMVMP